MSGKSIDYSFISGGSAMPFKKGTWKHLQEAYHEDLAEIVTRIFGKSVIDGGLPIVLWGCTDSVSGSDHTISDGAVFYQGRIYPVVGGTVTVGGGTTVVLNINTSYYTSSDADPVTFTDLSTHNVHKKEYLTVAAAASGWVNYSDLYFYDVAPEPWHYVGAAGEPAFASSNVVNDPGGTYDVVAFRRDHLQKTVTISGIVKVISLPDTGTVTAFTLPSGFRPSAKNQFTTHLKTTGGTLPLLIQAEIDSSGNVILYGSGLSYSNTFANLNITFRIP